ncbi:MAG TPA: UpxY family transcription antiterminator [Flavisolibacter sp.]|nr:UpxY family transcription antiterminator [Flavisolibacter sp.]
MSNGKNWYAVYTRPKWEKKVSELIGKKNLQTYCPLNRVVRQWSDRKKVIFEPLFTAYVFVQCTEKEHVLVKQTPGVINLVYWLKKPAVIRDVEIEMIQRFLNEHENVKLEKTPVNVNDIVRIVNGALMDEEGQVLEVRNKTVKVVLPSLGYAMSAELEIANVRVIYPGPGNYRNMASLP